ncbi:Homocysteine S-methyltransferase [Sphingomonas sp. EC-HK361]|uniref:homocysteine S-methyltransferase family protein n=1 Tax=Sphingomonas sp. EC-HK361 TaxID=2038397 RepID=UPI0012596760|nr:homocysteine S-methyltransferase family protein [Sphingomonas sp. EC-HK361]VVT25385.1 Homocysteine S-methyltransferase [Sphingomonas sp. EC-HK361]
MSLAPLPQFDRPLLTDAGLETDMIFNRGIDLPHFASIILLRSAEGRQALEAYFCGFLDLARRMGSGLILESATWRASPDWAGPLGMSGAELDGLNRDAIDVLIRLRQAYGSTVAPMIVSGCIGPRGDGYDPGRIMSVEDAESYHAHQSKVLASAGADMLTGITMTNIPEAIGIARAARTLAVPVAISFTVEMDGRLPTGDSLGDAVTAVDEALSGYPAYYMINCAHPSHFAATLDDGAEWTSRIRGMRANASRCSHAELDAMTELDIGDMAELAALYRDIRHRHPGITVLGGCCGTDLRHITAIAEACLDS